MRASFLTGTPFRLGAIAAVVTFAVLGGTAANAYWTASATATSSAKAATLAITTAGFDTVGFTFGNEAYSTTGSVTVTNTTAPATTTVPDVRIAFSSAGGDTALPGKIKLAVWPNTTAACTPATATPASATTGTWASALAITGTLASSVTYCVRSYVNDRSEIVSTAATVSFTPQVTATLSKYNFSRAAAATTTQTTRYVFAPITVSSVNWNYVRIVGTTQCMDVEGAATGSGTNVISYPCKTGNGADTYNQLWQFVDSGFAGFQEIRPRNSPTLRSDDNLSAAAGGTITVRTDTSTAGQAWQLQVQSSGVYQLVNKFTGLCLTGSTVSAAVMTQEICDGRALQKFELLTNDVVQLENWVCTPTGSGNARRVTYSWATTGRGPFTVQAQETANSAYVAIAAATTATGATVAITGTMPTNDPILGWPSILTTSTTYPMRVVDGAGNVVYSGTIGVTRGTNFTFYLVCGT